MQIQLIVADENRSGQVIPVNVPSFMIGRAENCNLRSRSSQVSRFHCTITVKDGTVMVQDLGGENGTFVNGNRVPSVQPLKDGDKLVVGTHSFVVSIKAETSEAKAGRPEANQGGFFELTPSSILKSEQSDTTRPADSTKKVVAKENAKKPEQESEITFEVRIDGQRVSVTKSRLFDLARKGSVLPDDLVVVAGTKVFADSIQGIVFGNKSSAPPSPPPSPPPVSPSPGSAARPTATPPAASEADPFALPDLGDVAGEANFFDNVAAEPFVRVARKESAFGAIWNALDISFSRVYTIEGNNLVIHSLKALYYVLVVGFFLVILNYVVHFGVAWNESGDFMLALRGNYIGLASVTFGGIVIVVIVRVLLEMLLLAWIESSKAEKEDDKNDDGKG